MRCCVSRNVKLTLNKMIHGSAFDVTMIDLQKRGGRLFTYQRCGYEKQERIRNQNS